MEVTEAVPLLHGVAWEEEFPLTATWAPVCLGTGWSSSSALFQRLASIKWEHFTHELKQTQVALAIGVQTPEVWLGQMDGKCQIYPLGPWLHAL